jgi:hypothetical protein
MSKYAHWDVCSLGIPENMVTNKALFFFNRLHNFCLSPLFYEVQSKTMALFTGKFAVGRLAFGLCHH